MDTFSIPQGLVVLMEAPSVKAIVPAGTFSISYEMVALAVGLVVMVALYFLPAFIAFRRRHRNRVAILVTNIFLGATGIGWIAALIWAFINDVEPARGEPETGSDRPRPRVPPTL